MGFFDKIAEGIKKTRDSMMSKVNSLINSFTKIDEDFFEELEETLIMCDIGVQTSVDICAELRKKVKEKGTTDPMLIKDELKAIITEMLGEDKKLDLSTKPSVVLVIGVNGAGKTTTIGKLAAQLTNQGKKVIVAAADTFRAAAIDQLQIWVDRAGADIVSTMKAATPLPLCLMQSLPQRQEMRTLLSAIPQADFTIKRTLWTNLRRSTELLTTRQGTARARSCWFWTLQRVRMR